MGVREERIFVTGMGPIVAQGADPVRFTQKHSIDGPMVLFLGQHYPYKGYRQVLHAAKSVWQKVPEAHLVFIGPPVRNSEDEFMAFKDRRIHYLGKVDLQEKTNALAACYLLCVPSTQESFGGVYTEAWTFAKPVIGCKVPAVSEVIADGTDGFLVDQVTNEIAEKICYLLMHPARSAGDGKARAEKGTGAIYMAADCGTDRARLSESPDAKRCCCGESRSDFTIADADNGNCNLKAVAVYSGFQPLSHAGRRREFCCAYRRSSGTCRP